MIPVSGRFPRKFDVGFWSGWYKLPVRWNRHGRYLTYPAIAEGDDDNVWAQPIDGGRPWQLTRFSQAWIHQFAWSKDGKQLITSRQHVEGDLVLIKNFR